MRKSILKMLNNSAVIFGAMLTGSLSVSAQTTFNYTGSPQSYVVPAGVTSINVSAAGAQGGGSNGGGGGLGAAISGDFNVTPGDVLTIIVGQEGQLQIGGQAENSSGGGGGSFVYNASNVLFVAAGGGGGKCNYLGSAPLHADAAGQVGTAGGASSDGNLGGTAGGPGNQGLWSGTPCAGGGAGWLLAGSGPYDGFNAPSWAGGTPYCTGGGGGCGGYGGFGGGGGGGNLYGGGGGGGGYSGGGGGTDPTHGGGGGSYNGGTNQMNVGGVQTGNGIVTITVLCTATSITPDLNSLADLNGICSVAMPTAPTATNDCGNTVDGTPDVTFPVTNLGTTVVTWTYDDGVGNTTTQTQNVVISGVDVSTSVTGATISAANPSGVYQWLYCDSNYMMISGETNQSYTPTVTGMYAVEITDGACVDTSACILIDFTGIDEINLNTVTLYPNPSTGQFNVVCSGKMESIEVLDMLGRALDVPADLNTGVVDGSALSKGKYLVRIVSANNVLTKEIVILK